MNEVKIPEGWKPCNPSECTFGYHPGVGIMELVPGIPDIAVHGEFGRLYNWCWGIFGIIPIRKSRPPDPIEFVLGEPLITKHESDDSYGITSEYTRTSFELPKSVKPGMRFREVQD